MATLGLTGGQYRPLTETQIETIHQSALTVLEKTGLTYEPGMDDTLAMLEKAGATIDRDRARIYLPRDMIREQTAKAPGKVVLFSRNQQYDLNLMENAVHLGTGGAAIKVLDLDTGKARPSTLKDLYQLGRLVDHLQNIHFFLRPCIPTDISENAYDVNVFYTCLKATAKHVMAGVNSVEDFRKVFELASMVAGGADRLQEKPFISIITSFAISPLKLDTLSTLIMQEAARHNIPVALSCAPMAGSTSPVTLAGTLVQTHAEQLSGITIGQLTNPGAPLLYGGIPSMANLKTMGYVGGGVECGMMNGAIHQMAAYIGVPNYNSSGLSDSKLPDAQAGWEKAMTTLLGAMAGSNYMHHAAGMLESMLTVAYEQFVIDDEIIGMACRVLKGFEFDERHLALDVIDSVGPGGNYMTHDHTMDFMRKEYFYGNGVTDRKSRSKWEKDGELNAYERARTIVKKILAAEEKSYIPEDIDREIREKFDILL